MGDQLYLVMEKLNTMKKYIDELDSVSAVSWEEFEKDVWKRYAIERLIQLIIDLAIDINNLVLTYLQKPTSKDYFNTFIELGEAGVLPLDFAVSMAPSTGMRNRLVHQYESINPQIVFDAIPKTVTGYRQYIKLIHQYVR